MPGISRNCLRTSSTTALAARPTAVKALDKYTVQVTTPAASRDLMLLEIGCNMYTNPPEVWANGGDMSDWTKVIGSGPWMITNYVAGSEITLSRNPDYFEMDPLHPDQQLPYLDTLKLLIIPDSSSRGRSSMRSWPGP